MLGRDLAKWKNVGGENTAQEIKQQPEVWTQILELFIKDESLIKRDLSFLEPNIHEIILTGAGTSAFIAKALAPYLQKIGWMARAVDNTDLITDPCAYLKRKPTILINFARSGNSPETLENIEIAKKICGNDLYTINITCNNTGELAHKSQKWKNNFLFLLPEAVNDRGLAMTSSFTSMLLWAIMCFTKIDEVQIFLKTLIKNTIHIRDEQILNLVALSKANFKKIVVLGANELKGFAEEASLKNLELTNGEISTFYNSPLGFRHGPKAIIDGQTLVVYMMSTSKHARKYDYDVAKELAKESKYQKMIILDYNRDDKLKTVCDEYYYPKQTRKAPVIYAGLWYVYLMQVLAINNSLEHHKAPDNPCPTGEIGRVVSKFKIYHWKKD